MPLVRRTNVGPFERAAAPDPWSTRLLGLVILLVGLLLAYVLYEIWPAVVHSTGPTPKRQTITLFDGLLEFKPATESVLVLLVIVAGGLGAYVHAATSFAKYVGVRRFARSWNWWYLLRLPIGSALALILYFALRGGLVGTEATSADVNPYGIAALAALAGLFSKQAVDKLGEVFDTFFRTREEDREMDELEAPIPELEAVEPEAFSTSGAQALTLRGSRFNADSLVLIKSTVAGGAVRARNPDLPPEDTELVVTIPAGELPPGQYTVAVVTPPPGGGVSAERPLRVDP